MLLLLVVWLTAMPCAAAVGLPATPMPRQITVADGLPSNNVNGFAQDARGYLWLATDDGLARYDGRSYRIWRIENGLRDNWIWSIHVDARDRVWIGTENGGLAMLDRDRRRFHFYDHHGYPQMRGGAIWGITSTADGSVWFGSSASGLYRLRADGTMQRFQPRAGDPRSVPSVAITSVATAPDGSLWIGSFEGVSRWTGHDFEPLPLPAALRGQINRLYIDTAGELWIAGRDGTLLHRRSDGRLQEAQWPGTRAGLVRGMLLRDRHGSVWLDTLDGLGVGAGTRVDNVPLYSLAARDLVRPSWGGAFEDRDGSLWFASLDAGLWHLPAKWRQFSLLTNNRNDPASIGNPNVIAGAAAADGHLWLVGTGGVLDRLDPASGQVEHHLKAERGALWPRSLLADRDGRVWIGLPGVLLRYDPRLRQSRRWDEHAATDPAPADVIELLAQSGDGRIWNYSTLYGFQIRDRDGRVVRTLAPGTHGLAQGLIVNAMTTGPDGALWLASSAGVLAWRADEDRFAPVPGVLRKPVYALHVDTHAQVWLAGMGRVEWSRWQNGRLQVIDGLGVADGMPMLVAGGLSVDDDGIVWLASTRGLIRVDPARRSIRLYGPYDGLPNPQLRARTLLRSAHGQMLVAAAEGVVLFDPRKVQPLLQPPPLTIERIELRRGEQILELSEVRPLRLRSGDRDLRIVARTRALNGVQSSAYRFRLEGDDADWVEVGPSGERLFPRLSAGHYRLQMQGRTADGVWSETLLLRFQVLPPWWLSPWGLCALALLAAIVLLAAIALFRRRLRRLRALRREIDRRELAEQTSHAKSRFLATFGHEVRTPMTGVLGMSELLLGTGLDARQRHYVQAILGAGRHLLRLVNDTLDLARIESGRLELEPQPFSLRVLVDELRELVEPLAQQRGLEFRVELPIDGDIRVIGDVTRIRQILLNLIDNAVKFTEHGSVSFAITALRSRHGLRCEVSDTGPGISAEHQARIFRRFEQGEGMGGRSRYGGSGLGLAICRELAVAMGGRIEVDSRLGVGTRFVVELPLRWQALPLAATVAATMPTASTPTAPTPASGARRVLLVEDDAISAEVIAGLLRLQGHSVVHVPHALDALTELSQQRFELGLLDLDLPGLDGLALARQLRANGEQMALIAVTARTEADVESASAAAGFNGFLRKPLTGERLAAALAKVCVDVDRQN